MNKKHINPKELYDCSIFGMSQAVIDTDTKQLFISGQVDWNKNFEVTEKSIEGQFSNALKNLLIVLNEANSSISNLLQIRIYIKGELSEYMPIIAPILSKFLGDSYPSLTGVGVVSLASPDLLVEIEAIAKLN